MRKIIILLVLFIATTSYSQYKQILYNFTSIPQSLMSNPGAEVEYKWYFGIPLLSGISVNAGSSGFSAYDLFANDGVDFNTKLREVVSSTSRQDKVLLNEQLEVFTGGFRVGDWQNHYYLSFGMYQETDFLMYMPKDYAILLLEGNKEYVGKYFNLGDLSAKGEMLAVFHVGYNKKVNEKLILGARGKIYSSIVNFSSTNNSGYFYTIPDEDTFYEQVISSDLLVNTSGLTNYTDNYSGNATSDILKKAFFGGNLGLGFDAGLTYYLKKNSQLTVSIQDVGFIRHTKEVRNYSYKGYYDYEGLTPGFTTSSSDENIFEEMADAIPLDTLSTKYTTWRPAKLNSSFQYSFGKEKSAVCDCLGNDAKYQNSIGAQFFAMTAPRSPLVSLTAYYNRRLGSFLEVKAAYTVNSFSNTNIGLGASVNVGKVNFYVLADNVLAFKDVAKAQVLGLQFGITIISKEE